MTAYTIDPWVALGDPTRRAIFRRIAQAPAAVGELAKELPVSRPAVSQHLRVLKDARLVTDRAEGTRRIYAIDTRGLAVLRAELDEMWTGALEAFKRAAEGDERPSDDDNDNLTHDTTKEKS